MELFEVSIEPDPFDESGGHGLTIINPDYPVFVLAFCIFHKRHYAEDIIPALTQFKFQHFGHDMLILHEHDIRKEENDFNFRDREGENAFMAALGEMIEQENKVFEML